MEYLLIALAVAFNIIIILIKFEKKRIEDGIFDTAFLIIIAVVFGGSFGGLVVGTIASMIISLYLLKHPPKFFSKKEEQPAANFFETFKKRARREYP